MSLVGKLLKLPATASRAYEKFVKVDNEYSGILTCTVLCPGRPHSKKVSQVCDPSELSEGVEITHEEYIGALSRTL